MSSFYTSTAAPGAAGMAAHSPTLRVLVVDDHTIVRQGLLRLLGGAEFGWSIDEAGDGFQALEKIRAQRFDVAIVDLSMPGMSGLELVPRLRKEHPSLRVLVLSMHAEDAYAVRAFRAGANGYITKDHAATDLVRAVRKVAEGGTFVNTALAERMVLQMNGALEEAPHARLSDRELEVLRRLVRGQSLATIGKALHLSIKTISTYKSRIHEKLDLPNMAGLVRYGIDHGLDV